MTATDTQRAALVALIEAVSAGRVSRRAFGGALRDLPCKGHASALAREAAFCAYLGSLDAANALHDALLPGWGCQVTYAANGGFGSAYVFPGQIPQTGAQHAKADNPARAWLLAIFKAKLGMMA